jgi:hypothetical protein
MVATFDDAESNITCSTTTPAISGLLKPAPAALVLMEKAV